jgi:hypothetical protein
VNELLLYFTLCLERISLTLEGVEYKQELFTNKELKLKLKDMAVPSHLTPRSPYSRLHFRMGTRASYFISICLAHSEGVAAHLCAHLIILLLLFPCPLKRADYAAAA